MFYVLLYIILHTHTHIVNLFLTIRSGRVRDISIYYFLEGLRIGLKVLNYTKNI